MFVGINNLKKVMAMSGVADYYSGKNPGYESEDGELWRHVLAVSVISERLADKLSIPVKDDAFVAALLHDIGKLVLSEFVQNTGEEIAYIVGDGETSFPEAERQLLGLDHAQVGARVLERWKFPPNIVQAVERHHSDYSPSDTDLDNIVRMADTLAIIMGFETNVDGLAYRGEAEVCRRYSLTHEDLEVIMADSLEEITRVETDYGYSLEE